MDYGVVAAAIGTGIGSAGVIIARLIHTEKAIKDKIAEQVRAQLEAQLAPVLERQRESKRAFMAFGIKAMRRIEELHGAQKAASFAFGELSRGVTDALSRTEALLAEMSNKVNPDPGNADTTTETEAVKRPWVKDVIVIPGSAGSAATNPKKE